MEIVDPADGAKHHRWLEWVGLQAPPPEAESWVPVTRASKVDHAQAKTSDEADRLIKVLSEAGIEALQRSYEIQLGQPSKTRGPHWILNTFHTRVAVLVHNRDLGRATDVASHFIATLEHERESEVEPVSDEELTRLALEAGNDQTA